LKKKEEGEELEKHGSSYAARCLHKKRTLPRAQR